MKVQRKVQEMEASPKPPMDTMPLCDVKKVLYGLTPVSYTYKGAVVVDVPNTGCCYLRIDPCKTNYRSSRYRFNEVYALRDCLIQLSNTSRFNTSYDHVAYYIEGYIIPFERGERKDYRHKLTDQLKPILDKINCCLLDDLSKADSFGIRIAEKVAQS